MVLTEIRFSPVLSMASRVAEIQDDLRKNGFPVLRHSQNHAIEISPNQPPVVNVSDRWVFGDRLNSNFFVLTDRSLAFETLEYNRFDKICEWVSHALRSVQNRVDPAISGRIGIRYVNLIQPTSGLQAPDYLSSSMQGPTPEQLKTDSLLWRIEAVGSSSSDEIRVRVHQNSGGTVIPIDLLAPEIDTGRLPSPGQIVTILDLDCSNNTEEDFNPTPLVAKLQRLHNRAKITFWACVSPVALEAWGEVIDGEQAVAT